MYMAVLRSVSRSGRMERVPKKTRHEPTRLASKKLEDMCKCRKFVRVACIRYVDCALSFRKEVGNDTVLIDRYLDYLRGCRLG